MNSVKVRQMLQQFLIEDIGERDVTCEALFSHLHKGEARFVAKETGVFVGESIIKEGFYLLDEHVEVELCKRDGDSVAKGELIAIVKGSISAILSAERVVLNLIQRMSGVATFTSHAVALVESSTTRICDTRKTTPGLRMFEKHAVHCGGGFNHRYGLYDGVMLKDNHIAFAGSVSEAVRRVREKVGHMVKVEVEIETKDQLLEAIEAGADIIMFDNCSPETIKEWIFLVPPHIITEASGNITLENLHLYKDTGVHYISLGALTHSVKALDISLDVIETREEQLV
ncbi:carboxylating nicotinate-nucleotide diphosphorylase [Metabacillus iocasae]|uniref:nicotinate-nucleotide diphosphorylase (carboxylating) n=1 Tax=Priestia iocasae TaxID=2291674 RepID=A0ABS2QPJ9_9BACI|nr:carboxylating nicotinate-nucleotide diphosphorylase [Metabacillus iocasae]MBM7701383.1 nicotinate-nucleotide pyrophosphorylase (carboxylating) [Metabacillus iocasae]